MEATEDDSVDTVNNELRIQNMIDYKMSLQKTCSSSRDDKLCKLSGNSVKALSSRQSVLC